MIFPTKTFMQSGFPYDFPHLAEQGHQGHLWPQITGFAGKIGGNDTEMTRK